jgi:prepilin-type N-terminal cleavage/methylation domain-containing protein
MKKSDHPRSAFTLLEVLIALGLSVVLIAGVYGAIDLFYQYQVAGRGQIAGAQIMRALARRIDQDLGSIVMHVAETTETATGQAAETSQSSSLQSASAFSSATGISGSTGSASNNNSGNSAGSPSGNSNSFASSTGANQGTVSSPLNFGGIAESGTPITFGLIGTAELLHLSVSLPSRELSYAEVFGETADNGRASDLLLITYGLAPLSSEQLSILQKDLTVSRPANGLGRRARDLYSQLETTETPGSEDLLAPEVTEIFFRYFDGTNWVETWDSQATGALPRAIEVTFGFWNPPRRNDERARKSLDDGTVTYTSHLFHIPISLPASALGL